MKATKKRRMSEKEKTRAVPTSIGSIASDSIRIWDFPWCFSGIAISLAASQLAWRIMNEGEKKTTCQNMVNKRCAGRVLAPLHRL
jgi:hypothetical protein